MYPILWQWGEFAVPAWHAMFAIGALCAFFVMLHLARRTPDIDDHHVSMLFLTCYVCGYFGARLFAILVEEESLQGVGDFFSRLFSLGPMTFYGGAIGAFLGGISYCKLQKISISKCADFGLSAGMLALFFGRVGCFLNGDDYGLPVDIEPTPWWAVIFPNHPTEIPRYPVQLMEAVFALCLFFLGYYANVKQRCRPGTVAFLIATFYAVGRFFIEYLRGDPRGWPTLDLLSPAQVVSLVIILCANIGYTMYWYKQHKSL